MEELRLRSCRWCRQTFAECARSAPRWYCSCACRAVSDRHKHCMDSELHRRKKRALEGVKREPVEERPTAEIQALGEESAPACEPPGKVPITPPAVPPVAKIETRSADAPRPEGPQARTECGPQPKVEWSLVYYGPLREQAERLKGQWVACNRCGRRGLVISVGSAG